MSPMQCAFLMISFSAMMSMAFAKSETVLSTVSSNSKAIQLLFLSAFHTAFEMSPMQYAFLMMSFAAMMSMAFAENIFDGIEDGLNDAIDATGL
ncbi:unnamed protein product [Larinioides sclopetarius]|uniref:Uncharacterized protein n=1 Tax=Larinioides sclopetarius TaxID=280406 RepID=A0AAV1ZH75_9ARAC